MFQPSPPEQEAKPPSDPEPEDVVLGPGAGRPKWLPIMLWAVLLFYIALAAFLFSLLT